MLAIALFLPLHILDVRYQLIPRLWMRQQKTFWSEAKWQGLGFWRSMRHVWFCVAYFVSLPPSVGKPEKITTHLISLALAVALAAAVVSLERYSIQRGEIKDE